MRAHGAAIAVAVSVVVSAACAGQPSATTPATRAGATSPAPVMPLAAEQICGHVLGARGLLDWAPATVAEFRSYQYGGPKATVPLAHAFSGLPDDTRGAWCGTEGGPQTTHWWAAVVGHKAVSVITVNGPGEGVRHGPVSAPPRVP